jgi:hypothetical protein
MKSHDLINKRIMSEVKVAPKLNRRFPLKFIKRNQEFKVINGKWEVNHGQITTHFQNGKKRVESLALVGSRNWRDYTFEITFSFLTPSVKVYEGGIILYLRYKNRKNNYSFHFCFSAQRIEFWKRFQSLWSIVGNGIFCPFQLNNPYGVRLTCEGSKHSCYLNDILVLQIKDPDIDKGAVGIGAKYCSAECSNITIRHIA